MQAWRNRFPHDEVWGCIYSANEDIPHSEHEDWWKNMQRLDNITVKQLTIELVPRATWEKNYKPFIPSELWNMIAENRKKGSDYSCEECGWKENLYEEGKLVLHQKWLTCYITKKLVFLKFQVLCWRCHDVKHFCWSRIEGRLEDAVCQLEKMNSTWSGDELEEYIHYCCDKWREDSNSANQIQGIDDHNFQQLPEVQKWPDKSKFRFGSLCLARHGGYNCHPINQTNK